MSWILGRVLLDTKPPYPLYLDTLPLTSIRNLYPPDVRKFPEGHRGRGANQHFGVERGGYTGKGSEGRSTLPIETEKDHVEVPSRRSGRGGMVTGGGAPIRDVTVDTAGAEYERRLPQGASNIRSTYNRIWLGRPSGWRESGIVLGSGPLGVDR
eukprot:746391-Hanusia_phi.AAC.5